MMLVYLVLLLVLVMARLLVWRRVAALERKYARAARAAQEVAQQPVYKEGNSGRPDPYRVAKHQYLVGQLVQKRDRIEGRYATWQARAEGLARLAARLRGWKGRWVPYLFGAADAVAVLVLLGSGEELRQVIEAVASR